MIDSKVVVNIFKERFSKMSYHEREQYLQKMGIVFEAKQSERLNPQINQGTKVSFKYSRIKD